MNKVLHGDCVEELKKLPSDSVDSIVTDPPYGLGFMGKKWDSMPPAKEVFEECIRVLKPGGHLLSFGGTRTYHRMAVAIEDVGFEIRDMIEWCYGSGFPKSLNIGKAVDKLQGNEREVVGVSPHFCEGRTVDNFGVAGEGTTGQRDRTLTKGTSEWEGWGTALKPAHEPICMARKPLSEKTVAKNCLKWGTGGINIGESRVGNEVLKEHKSGNIPNDRGQWGLKEGYVMPERQGRFPANFIHDNSDEVRECFPDTNERYFKSILYQAKVSKKERNAGCENMKQKQYSYDGRNKEIENPYQRNKSVAKNNHPTVKPIALMEYLIKMVTPEGGVVLDPFAGSGTTLVAAKQNGFNYIGIEITGEYLPIIEARLNSVEVKEE